MQTFDTWLTSGCEYPGDDAPDNERDDEMSDFETTMTPDESELYASALNALSALNETRLAALQNAIDIELRKRLEHHTRAATAAKHALERTKPRAKRSDAGTKREKKAEAAA